MAKEENVKEEKVEEVKVEKGNNKALIIVGFLILILAIIIVSTILICGNNKDIEQKNNKEENEIKQSQEKALIEFEENFTIGKEMSYNELISKLVNTNQIKENTKITLKVNDKEITEDEKYVFNEIGKYKVDVKLEYKKEESVIINEKSSEINIMADSEKPVISGISDKTITVGDKIDLKAGITAEDSVDGKLDVTIEGKVDNKKAGKYDIKVIATDKSGNKQEETFTVTVKEKKKNETANKTTNTTATNKTTNTNKTNANKNTTTKTTKKKEQTKKTFTTSELIAAGKSAKSSYRTQINAVFSYTNKYREKAGVEKLKLDETLSTAACMRAVEMAYSGNFSHTRPDGKGNCFTVLSEVGANYGYVGENIAMGQASAKAATEWWRNSSGHYQNMISSNFKKIGVGAFKYNGKYYWVQIFTD